MRRLLLLLGAGVLLAPAPVLAGVQPGGELPNACRNSAFGDRVGTAGNDLMVAARGTERLFGLDAPDWLVGSDAVAACLFGGRGDDVLTMTPPGGVALGEEGSDVISGAGGPDALTGGSGFDLLAGAEGNDVLRGGRGVDGLDGGEGDDILEDTDGRGEVLDCGPGTDTVIGDRKDVLLDCEEGSQAGDPMTVYPVRPERGGPRRVFGIAFRAPVQVRGGAFGVLASSRCAPGLRELRRFPAADDEIERGDVHDLRLRPPAGGWCTGPTTGLIVRQPGCAPGNPCGVPRPIEVLGRFRLRVR